MKDDRRRHTKDRATTRPRLLANDPRPCIGNGFAKVEATLLPAAVTWRFRLEPIEGANPEPQPSVAPRPRDGGVVTFKKEP